MSGCPITGEAHARDVNGAIEWTRTDPQIHITDDLLEHPTATERIREMYRVEEPCNVTPGTHHATLRVTA